MAGTKNAERAFASRAGRDKKGRHINFMCRVRGIQCWNIFKKNNVSICHLVISH